MEIPAGTSAGLYHSAIHVNSGASTLATIPITIEVWPIELPPTHAMRTEATSLGYDSASAQTLLDLDVTHHKYGASGLSWNWNTGSQTLTLNTAAYENAMTTLVDGVSVPALALLQGLPPEPQCRRSLRQTLKQEDGPLDRAELSSLSFTYRALLAGSSQNIRWVLDDVRRVFGGMLRGGATSFWEARAGSSGFRDAGSLCHGWSAVFPYIAGADLLGVKPLQPGFKWFAVHPLTGGLTHARGRVPTPHGPIDVAWNIESGKMQLRVRHPQCLEMKIPSSVRKKVELI